MDIQRYLSILFPKHVLRYSNLPPVDQWQPFAFIELGVIVAPSGIRGAGLGLFTTRAFKTGDTMCLYSGRCIKMYEGSDNVWVLQTLWKNPETGLDEIWHLDSNDYMNLSARRANDACDLETYPHDDPNIHEGIRTPFYNNAKFHTHCSDDTHPIAGKYTTELIAVVDIDPFTEIFTPYGSEFWGKCPRYSRFADHRFIKY